MNTLCGPPECGPLSRRSNDRRSSRVVERIWVVIKFREGGKGTVVCIRASEPGRFHDGAQNS